MQGKAPKCHFFSSFFANKLYKDTGYGYDQVPAVWGREGVRCWRGMRRARSLGCCGA